MADGPKRCQSCGVPLVNESIFGTEENGDKSSEYCIFCFEKGRFTEPEITMEEMIKKCSKILSEKSEISKEQARAVMENTIPKLKRWQH